MAYVQAAIALASIGYSIYSGMQQKKEAKEKLDNLKVPELNNAFEDIQISTVGSELMREESQRTNATLVDAVRSGGTRSVMSSIPKIVALNNNQNKKARKYIDDQVIDRDYGIAGESRQIRRLEENRYLGDVHGLGNLYNVGSQNEWNGMRGAVALGGTVDRMDFWGPNDKDTE